MNGIGKEKSSRQTEMKNTHTQILESCNENRMHNIVWPMSKTTSKNVAIFLRFGFFLLSLGPPVYTVFYHAFVLLLYCWLLLCIIVWLFVQLLVSGAPNKTYEFCASVFQKACCHFSSSPPWFNISSVPTWACIIKKWREKKKHTPETVNCEWIAISCGTLLSSLQNSIDSDTLRKHKFYGYLLSWNVKNGFEKKLELVKIRI